MAKAHITQKWIKDSKASIEDGTFDMTTIYNNAAQIAIKLFVELDKPFKLYNLGAGVKRITSETDICPCCKRRL